MIGRAIEITCFAFLALLAAVPSFWTVALAAWAIRGGDYPTPSDPPSWLDSLLAMSIIAPAVWITAKSARAYYLTADIKQTVMSSLVSLGALSIVCFCIACLIMATGNYGTCLVFASVIALSIGASIGVVWYRSAIVSASFPIRSGVVGQTLAAVGILSAAQVTYLLVGQSNLLALGRSAMRVGLLVAIVLAFSINRPKLKVQDLNWAWRVLDMALLSYVAWDLAFCSGIDLLSLFKDVRLFRRHATGMWGVSVALGFLGAAVSLQYYMQRKGDLSYRAIFVHVCIAFVAVVFGRCIGVAGP